LATRRLAGGRSGSEITQLKHQPADMMKKEENTQKAQPQPQPQKKITLKDLKARKEVKGGVRQI
jgi:hypothetical protein